MSIRHEDASVPRTVIVSDQFVVLFLLSVLLLLLSLLSVLSVLPLLASYFAFNYLNSFVLNNGISSLQTLALRLSDVSAQQLQTSP